MAILIKHLGMTASGFARASVKTDSLAEYDETNASYALGYRLPNYPVPAIRTHVTYASDGIELYKEDYSRDFGEYVFFPY